MKQTLRTRWFNWRWRPANIWGRYRLRHLPTVTPAAKPPVSEALRSDALGVLECPTCGQAIDLRFPPPPINTIPSTGVEEHG
jgi:hypothetical protein